MEGVFIPFMHSSQHKMNDKNRKEIHSFDKHSNMKLGACTLMTHGTELLIKA